MHFSYPNESQSQIKLDATTTARLSHPRSVSNRNSCTVENVDLFATVVHNFFFCVCISSRMTLMMMMSTLWRTPQLMDFLWQLKTCSQKQDLPTETQQPAFTGIIGKPLTNLRPVSAAVVHFPQLSLRVKHCTFWSWLYYTLSHSPCRHAMSSAFHHRK